jgi:hypothetical protein
MPDYLSSITAAAISRGKGSITSDTLERVQNAAESWAQNTEHELQMKVPTNSGGLFNSIKRKVRMRDGFPSSITFGMKRYGVYLEKGAGAGHGGDGKSTWTYEGKGKRFSKYNKGKGNRRTAAPSSVGKLNTGNRQAKPWFNPTIEDNINQLADSVAEAMGDVVMDIAVKAIGIK